MEISSELFFALRVSWFCASLPGIVCSYLNLRRALKTRSLVREAALDGARSLMAEQGVVVEGNRLMAQVILSAVGVTGLTQGLVGAVDIQRGLGAVGITAVIVLLTFSSAYSYICGIALDRLIEASRMGYKV